MVRMFFSAVDEGGVAVAAHARGGSGLRARDADSLSRREAEAELSALTEEIGAHDLLYYQVRFNFSVDIIVGSYG